MKIIVSGRGYPEKRNIIVNEQHTYLDFKYKNIWLYINAIRRRVGKANKFFIFHPVNFLLPGDTQVIHLFNEVACTRRRWIATFETELPRVLPVPDLPKLTNPELKKELKLVAAPQCVAIVAMSEAAKQIQLNMLAAFPEEAPAIIRKLHRLHPPQPVLYEGAKPVRDGKLIFTFAGNEFYRKGGAEVVLAFCELIDEGVIGAESVEVNIIGNLSHRYNFAHGRYQDSEAFYQRIETLLQTTSIFKHAVALESAALMALFRRTHVGLLPSWQDTYGFSVLEMQASGCPVISTNIRALPEINPPEAGWMIHCPLTAMFELEIASDEAKLALRALMVTQLKALIKAIVADPGLVATRAAGALARIRRDHDPARFKATLDALYLLAHAG